MQAHQAKACGLVERHQRLSCESTVCIGLQHPNKHLCRFMLKFRNCRDANILREKQQKKAAEKAAAEAAERKAALEAAAQKGTKK